MVQAEQLLPREEQILSVIEQRFSNSPMLPLFKQIIELTRGFQDSQMITFTASQEKEWFKDEAKDFDEFCKAVGREGQMEIRMFDDGGGCVECSFKKSDEE